MKTLFNKFMMAMVAVVMVIGFSAFKMVDSNDSRSFYLTWYFNGGANEETDATKYSLLQDPNLECSGTEETICSISAPSDPFDSNIPDLNHIVNPEEDPSKTVQDFIEEAMLNLGNSNSVVLEFRELQ